MFAIALAIFAALAMIFSNVNAGTALIVLLVWVGSLALVGSAPPIHSDVQRGEDFSTDRMSDLIENSSPPVLVTRRQKIIIANAAARKLLGAHIVNQDARIALRHPEAVRLIESSQSGTAMVRGLVRRRDIWEIKRKFLEGGLAIFEFVNRTAEADISRAHTDFVANASHELRTPLASIIGYVETLKDDPENIDSKTAKSFLNTIEKEALRMRDLVGELMSLSRIEAEKHDRPSAEVDLAALVERAAMQAAGPQHAERIDFEAHGDFTVLGDVGQLEQLTRNLVDNALKYGRQGEEVTIRLQPQGKKRVRLSIRDRGDGIAPEHIPHLTRRFFRTDPGRSRAAGGTGLGLAIVKHVVERHNGRINITSELGEGTSVKVLLPIAK